MDKEHSLETMHLSKTIAIAQEQIGELQQKADTANTNIITAKKEMYEETSHSIGNLWDSDAFEQLAELSQYATQVSKNIDSYETIITNIKKLEKLVKSPYFARIDFQFPNQNALQNIYIGRSSLKQGRKIMIHDWRAPISSVFYRFGLGNAFYEAPVGKISGTVSLKRQYEIKDGELEYFFDADIEILDEYLRKMLSHNTLPQMKSIVETIQREQDVVIRDLSNDLLIVQGVAGSGKTSIALHRIAYLMYSGLTNKLSNQSIIIISPNEVFEKYISNVLPELGEENVQSILMDEIHEIVLDRRNIQTRYQLLETLMTNEGDWVPVMGSSLKFKGSAVFKQILDKLNIHGSTVRDILFEYKSLFSDSSYFYQMAGDVELPYDIEDILRFTKENLTSSRIYFDDASALTYLCLKRNRYDDYRHIRQVVIDEAQDYYPLHFEIFKMLFPNAQYTILGDINQTIEKPETMDFYQEIQGIFGKRRSSLVTLAKSFRCSNEIIQFCASIIGENIKSFGREGIKPIIYRQDDEWSTGPVIKEIAEAKAAGYQSIGILCKSDKDCKRLYNALSDRTDVHLINDVASAKLVGTFILPTYLSKGVEFDVAFIWGVDKKNYYTENDKSLLFIGCTRALHRLSLFYSDELSALLTKLSGPDEDVFCSGDLPNPALKLTDGV